MKQKRMRLGNLTSSRASGCSRGELWEVPARAKDHHCLLALMKSSPPLPQNSCQYQESDLERHHSKVALPWGELA